MLQGRKHEAGSVARVPAMEIERRVAEAVQTVLSRLMDLPIVWSDQWSTLGLNAPAQA